MSKIAFLLFGIRALFAYIDPNTGGMLFQLLAVVFGLISGLILFFSSRIKMLFARLRRRVRNRGELEETDLSADDVP